MAIETNIHYKILFDAMANFSISAYKVDRFEELADIMARQLKYLFNFQNFKYFHIDNGFFQSVHLDQDKCYLTEGNVTDFEEDEMETFQTNIPFLRQWTEGQENCEKRGWKFLVGDDSYTMITLTSMDPKLFTTRYIPILRLVNEVVSSKIRNIKLLSLLNTKNTELAKATQELQIQNKKIESLIKEQEKIINTRTRDLTNSNRKLTSLIQFNAHQIREPLTRILSLIEIKNDMDDKEFISDFLPMIEISVTDLDNSIQEIIKTSEILS